ncbi:PepSY domain-containing protein [Streptomyces sp. 900116325]
MWALLRRLHFYAGVFVAPFLLLAALTGLAYALTPQLDQLVYGDELRVERTAPPPAAGHRPSHHAQHPGTLY